MNNLDYSNCNRVTEVFLKRFRNLVTGLAAIAGLALPLEIQAGVKITAQIENGKEKLPLSFWLEKSKVRLDSQAQGKAYRVLYDGAANTISVLDMQKKTALSIPISQMEMFASLAHQFTKDKKPQDLSSIEYRKSGRTKKIGAWTCEVYELLKNKVSQGELCSMALPELGLSKSDLEPLKKLSQSLQPLMKTTTGSASYPDYLWNKIDDLGLAIEATGKEGGQAFRFVTQSIEKANYGEDVFQAPQGFQSVNLMKN